jgi:hypothetical protein
MTEFTGDNTDEGTQEVEGDQQGAESTQTDPNEEIAKWKKHSRTWEERSKANLEKVRTLEAKTTAGDIEQINAALAAAQQDASEARREAAMYRVAITHSLTAEDLELLTYVPLDELDVAAGKLAARVARRTPDLGQGVGQSTSPVNDMNSMMRRAAGLE